MATVASLSNWNVGQLRPVPTITWVQSDGTVQDLTNVSSITGIMKNLGTGTSKAIAGTLAVSDASAGQFTWTMAAGDVDTAGQWDLQFTAIYSSGATPAISYRASWYIAEALSV